ncbi:MAG: YidB family protein [Janthinobacterium lividum]
MGLLDSVIGSLMGGAAGGSSSPMGGVLSSLLGGGGGQAVGGMGAQGMGGMSGGLGGLVSQFEQAGLGHVAQSWVSNGPNQSVSPEQLQNVFGANQVQGMASQAGMQPQDFLAQLSQHLPEAVHGMTPNGQLPDEGTMSV